MTATFQMLAEGSTVELASSGLGGRIGSLLGAGAQGAAYLTDIAGGQFVVKWYHDHIVTADTRLRTRLEQAVRIGAPDARFLWPIDLVAIPGRAGLGYLMPLRGEHFRNLQDLIAGPPRRIEPTLAVRANACLNIAECFLRLHAEGLCYRDINFGAFFVDPAAGDISICDIDNVDVNGAPATVYGTRKFMAPEVVRRERMPDANTDLYSMAVLFFYILHSWHPLEGRAEHEIAVMNDELEMQLYGTHPCFMFDAHDRSNAPVADFHDTVVLRWRSLSVRLRQDFIAAFTTGLAAGEERIVETQWRSAMARLRSSIFACPHCGYEHAIDADDDDAAPERFVCVSCHGDIAIPPRLAVGRETIVLDRGSRLFPHHVLPGRAYDFGTPLAAVDGHPQYPAVMGLRNLSDRTWACRLPDGTATEVPPGRTIRLLDRLDVDFGARRGIVSL